MNEMEDEMNKRKEIGRQDKKIEVKWPQKEIKTRKVEKEKNMKWMEIGKERQGDRKKEFQKWDR